MNLDEKTLLQFHATTPVNRALWQRPENCVRKSPETFRRLVGGAITLGSQCKSYADSLPRWLTGTMDLVEDSAAATEGANVSPSLEVAAGPRSPRRRLRSEDRFRSTVGLDATAETSLCRPGGETTRDWLTGAVNRPVACTQHKGNWSPDGFALLARWLATALEVAERVGPPDFANMSRAAAQRHTSRRRRDRRRRHSGERDLRRRTREGSARRRRRKHVERSLEFKVMADVPRRSDRHVPAEAVHRVPDVPAQAVRAMRLLFA